MKRSKLGVLGLWAMLTAIAQVAVAQNGGQNGSQSATPQPTTQNSNDVAVVRPKQSRPQNQERQRQQRGRNQQTQTPQQPSQQPQIARVQPQQLEQRAEEQLPQTPVVQQSQSQQQEQTRKQHVARGVHRSHPVPASVMSYTTALEKCQRDRHPHVWWTQHYAVIVYSVGGYYYFDAGYWYPALGYSPNYESYDYDGPIYTYGNLLPDQVILNVQRALKDLGYFDGALSGSLSAATRYAISAYQQDNGLTVNGVVDAPLVYSLGLQ